MIWIQEHTRLSVRRACRVLGLTRSCWYRPKAQAKTEDTTIQDALNAVVGEHARWGFWKCFHWLRQQGFKWNHKRVWRIYCDLRLNLPRRIRRRLPVGKAQPLDVPNCADVMWSMDFMLDSLACGKRFRVLNIIDEGVREALHIEIDTSLPAARVVRALEQIKEEGRKLPEQIRVDNGPEFISGALSEWAENNGVSLHFIQPGKPAQNAYIERFNRSFRCEILDAHLFGSLSEVREIADEWKRIYNEERPHESLGNVPPSVYAAQTTAMASSPERQAPENNDLFSGSRTEDAAGNSGSRHPSGINGVLPASGSPPIIPLEPGALPAL